MCTHVCFTHTHTHSPYTCTKSYVETYGVSTISRLLKNVGLFCRISSLLQGSFAKATCNFKEPTNRSHRIEEARRCVQDAEHIYVRIDICTCVCACVCVCVYICAYLCVHMYMYVYASVCLCVCARVCLHVCVCILFFPRRRGVRGGAAVFARYRAHLCAHPHLHICLRIRVCMCMCMCAYTCVYVYVYLYTRVSVRLCVYDCVSMTVCLCTCLFMCLYVYSFYFIGGRELQKSQ